MGLSDVESTLVDAAVQIANESWPRPVELEHLGEIFFNANNRTGSDRYTISIIDGVMDLVPSGRKAVVYQQLTEIATEAMGRALRENAKEFVGLIIAEARAGRNYLDRFR